MGYRIVYGEDPFVPGKKGKSRVRLMTAGFLLALILGVRCCWPEGTALLRQTFLPSEDDAFRQFTAQIQAGEPPGEAVTAFCRELVEGSLGED